MCDCIRLMSEALATTNTDLDIPLRIDWETGTSLPARMMIATVKRDSRRRMQTNLLVCNYCPNCGEKYEDEPAVKEQADG